MRYYVAVCNEKIYGFSGNRLTALLEAEEAIGPQYIWRFPIEIRDVTETQFEAVCDGIRDWSELEYADGRKSTSHPSNASEGGKESAKLCPAVSESGEHCLLEQGHDKTFDCWHESDVARWPT